jgi:hypothetical protein
MYELDYGPLYGYGFIITLSVLAASDLARTARSRWRRFGSGLLAALFMVLSFVDSKRYTAMAAIAAAIAYFLRARVIRALRMRTIALVCGGGMTFYFVGALVRIAFDPTVLAIPALMFQMVGVEYRDFVQSVIRFEPGRIPNYDWLASAVGAMVNSSVLDAFGIRKQDLVEMGSAYAWKPLFGTELGIRTGIVSELYFAYGLGGLFIIFLFGVLTAWLSARIAAATSRLRLMFLSVLYGLFFMSIVGQTMATTGTLTVLLYTWVGLWVVRRALQPRGVLSTREAN